MANKRVPLVYSPTDNGNTPSPNIPESQFNRYGYPDYQKGWNDQEISNPKLLYYEGSGPQKSKFMPAEPRTTDEREKRKNVKSQIKRALSLKKENSDKETRWHKKPLQKARSMEVVGKRPEKLYKNQDIADGLYPDLENMINTYSDNFGYDGRKENLARKYSDNATKSYPVSYEPYVGNYGRKHNDNSHIPPPNMSAKKESHIPVTSHNPVKPAGVSKEHLLNSPQVFVSVMPPLPVKVNPTPKQNVGLPKGNSTGSVTTIVAPVISLTASPPRKVPPPVRQKPEKVSNLDAIDEDEKEKPSILKLIELSEIILHQLNSWKEITKEIKDLDSQLEALISLLMSLSVHKQRKPSLTESIASALDSFSFLATDDDHDIINDVTSPPEDILPKKADMYYQALFHHLSALNDLIKGFQPSSGPLNVREKLYYNWIYKQKLFICQISEIIHNVDGLSLKSVCKQFCESGTLATVWNSCATKEQPLHCTCVQFAEVLNLHCQRMNEKDNNTYLNTAEVREGVCSKVVNELRELNVYKTDNKFITVFQFVGFFKNDVRCPHVMDYVTQTVGEFLMLKVLYSKDDLLVMSTLQQYWRIPVVKSCIQCLLSFLTGDKVSRKGASLHALTKLYENTENKSMILEIIIASLEECNIRIKAGACIALGKFKVQGISKKLIYLFQTDTSLVKEAAENGLKDLGHNLIRR